MNEAPQKLFSIILDDLQERMQVFGSSLPPFQYLSVMQHGLSVGTLMTLAPLCAGTCEECHATARGTLVLAAVATKAIDEQMCSYMSDPEYREPVLELLAKLRAAMADVGTNPGALTEQDLIDLGINPEPNESTPNEAPKE